MNVGKFILNVVVAFIAYGVFYTLSEMVFAAQFEAMRGHMHPEEAVLMPHLAYHFVQTVVVVWLFNKAVGSGDVKAGAMFGVMMGLYLVATDAIWFTGLKDIPGDARLPLGITHLVVGAIIGALLAFMWGKGWGSGAADEAAANDS